MNKHLNIFIVEDEPLICATIETALRKHGFKVLGDADNFIDALQAIQTLKPDLVLIDIQLEGNKDGIDLAIQLDSLSIPYVYLTSQTDPDTIERVKSSKPLGYIVKPFTENSLRSNIELAWHNYKSNYPQHLIIRSEGRTHKINQNDILFLKAFDNYCYVITTSKSYLVPHTLKHISEQLDKTDFVKTHRSYWVNLQHIKSIEKNTIHIGNQSIQLSYTQKALVLKRFKS